MISGTSDARGSNCGSTLGFEFVEVAEVVDFVELVESVLLAMLAADERVAVADLPLFLGASGTGLKGPDGAAARLGNGCTASVLAAYLAFLALGSIGPDAAPVGAGEWVRLADWIDMVRFPYFIGSVL